MPNLRKLKVAIALLPYSGPVNEPIQVALLEPLDQLRGTHLDVFEVHFPSSFVRQLRLGAKGVRLIPWVKYRTLVRVNSYQGDHKF
jgi:hypothetical protein